MVLTLSQAIIRFQENEERLDVFTNGGQTDTFTTSEGDVVPSLQKFIKDKDAQIETLYEVAQTSMFTRVLDRATLKGLNTESFVLAFLDETGREGMFKWMEGDFSTEIAADTLEGVYVKATAVSATLGAWVRQGQPVLSNFGGSPDTNSAAAATAMAALLGKVVIGPGTHLFTTATISVPVLFMDGASVTVNSPNTLTLASRIESSRQHIFRGTGLVALQFTGGSDPEGEDCRNTHVSWWGVFPSGDVQTAAIQRALNAYSTQGREGIIDFDNGSYRIDGKLTIPRGVHLRGCGTRRTIFDLVGQGYTAMEAAGDAVKITGIQFEQPAGMESSRTGILIDLLDWNGCVVDDIWLWGTHIGIKSSGNDCRITRIAGRYDYGSAPGANSALVWLAGGARIMLDDLSVSGQLYGPESIVLIGKGNASTMSMIDINNVMTTEQSIPVNVVADTANVSMVSVNGVIHAGSTGETIDALVKLVTSGSAAISAVNINGLVANSIASALVAIIQGSSASTYYVTIGSGVIYGSTGSGVSLTRTNGTLNYVTIGSDVNAIVRATPVLMTGTMSNILGADGGGGFRAPQATSTEIASSSSDINQKNKYAGKIIFDSTNIRLMVAAGGAATSPWRVCDNSASVTPS